MSFATTSLARRCALHAAKRSSVKAAAVAPSAWRSALLLANETNINRQAQPNRNTTIRYFSDSGSHSDFAPQRKPVKDDDDEAVKMIEQHVKEHDVMLYMKGSPNMPMCGFSARVVQVLKSTGVDFSSVNVLDYPSIREGVKQYSDWPTIPQLYVKGEFVGGCDIVESMYESGELKEMVQEFVKEEEK
mmetsp:Transcript_3332/g.6964  ORF Transcript_3332/g.6964 Transcript_3332/m.6964 type:complete len:188 (+) Transcript_3332:71-634(+)